MALALANTAPSLTKSGLTELSFALQAKYMRAKSAVQIRARIKNLRIRDGDDNPVVHYIRTGEARAAVVPITLVSGNIISIVIFFPS